MFNQEFSNVLNANFKVIDFANLVNELKNVGVPTIRKGEAENISELARTIAFSDAKLTEYSIEEIFSKSGDKYGGNYEMCKAHIEKNYPLPTYSTKELDLNLVEMFPGEPSSHYTYKVVSWSFEELLAIFLMITWELSKEIEFHERLKVYLKKDELVVQIIKGHYSQFIHVKEEIFDQYSRNLNMFVLEQIKEVYNTIKNTKLLTNVTLNRRVK